MKKSTTIHEKKTLSCCSRNPSSFEDNVQMKTQSFPILVVWLFDSNFDALLFHTSFLIKKNYENIKSNLRNKKITSFNYHSKSSHSRCRYIYLLNCLNLSHTKAKKPFPFEYCRQRQGRLMCWIMSWLLTSEFSGGLV